MTPNDHFWKRVRIGGLLECWLWLGAKSTAGYGQIVTGSKTDGTRRVVYAHRYVYEMEIGPIPDGLHIDHLCRNRACVNPAHLEAVTCRVNLLRGRGRTALNACKTHCPKGHPYDERNTRISNGKRDCRACDREQGRIRCAKPGYNEYQRAARARRRQEASL